MRTEDLRMMLKYRITSPNNATHHFCKYLQNSDIEVVGGKRKYAVVDGKYYCITITSYDSLHIDCRQFDRDGVISFYEKTGKVYLLEKSQLHILDNTRELNEKEYKQAYSTLKIDYLKPYNKIEQLKTKKYKEIYMDVAYNVSNEIIANTYRKLV